MKQLAIYSILFLMSCKAAQVFKVTPLSQNITANRLFTFENDTLKIQYTFWGESGGAVTYSITNKLPIPIYIDWKKCALIENGAKTDYWKDETIMSGLYTFRGDLDLGTFADWHHKQAVQIMSERITFLAPQSTIIKSVTGIVARKLKDIGKHNTTMLPVNNSTRKQRVAYIDYTANNTPFTFRNFLTFSTTEKMEQEHYIDHAFYVSGVYKIKQGDFMPHWFQKPTWFFVR